MDSISANEGWEVRRARRRRKAFTTKEEFALIRVEAADARRIIDDARREFNSRPKQVEFQGKPKSPTAKPIDYRWGK